MGKQIIVMTGGTSGLGAITSKEFLKKPDIKLLLGTRSKQMQGAENIPLDLQSLKSVRSFAADVMRQIGSEKINALVLNAGVSLSDIDSRTVDGLETTFAVNYFAHYFMIRLFMPHLAENACVVVTTSGTHNPAEETMIAPPKHANALWLAYPEKDPTLDKKVQVNAGRAYSSSKLCNILMVRSLNTLPEAKANKWKGIAYDPGPTPGTGLAQNGNFIRRLTWQLLTIPVLRKRLLPKSNSRQDAGRVLADIAMSKIDLPKGKTYLALRRGNITFPDPSEMALDDKIMAQLWQDSASLLDELIE